MVNFLGKKINFYFTLSAITTISSFLIRIKQTTNQTKKTSLK